MISDFIKNTSFISYSDKIYKNGTYNSIDEINIPTESEDILWLNTYGIDYHEVFKQIILDNKLDDFLIKLLMETNHANKVIVLDNMIFVAIKVLKTEGHQLDSEQMIFIVGQDFMWSIQEKSGDYFDWIRERLESFKGLVRRKKADYLFFLILESIIDNYYETYEKYDELTSSEFDANHIKPTPEFTSLVEKRKQELFNFKKSTKSLYDTIIKLEKVNMNGFKTKYFTEIKEQASTLMMNIDFELQELESNINMIFSIQGHRLNEVMKTLTILSVIFIPLTFLAGIYGMNFENIPELQWKYGYFMLLGVMFLVAVAVVWYFKKQKWF